MQMLDVETTAMEALWTAITTVITNVMNALGTVGNALLSNVIFQIMFGLLILFVVLGIIFRLVSHARNGN